MNGESKGGEFYVGYLPAAPRRLARTLRRTVLALGALAVALAILLVAGQQAFPTSTFEFGRYREFEGVFEKRPYPSLLVAGPEASISRYLLVAFGKHGADAETAVIRNGQRVRLRGSLIYRDTDKMIELSAGSASVAGSAPAFSGPELLDLGPVTLAGEIVDSKCYLGVMNPGSGKVHRACAARCVSGGIPPALAVKDSSGKLRLLLLTGSDGRALSREVLDFMAEPVEITGRLRRSLDTLILSADPTTFRRIGSTE